jgi:uncharacterized membrane protein
MKLYIVSYLAAALIFLGCDAVWLSIMGNALYRPALGDLMAPSFRVVPAVIFYALYVVGIVYFPITAAFASGRWSTALIQGACLGFFAYATYDLTNQATLRQWSTTVTVVDMAWGTIATAIAATVAYLIARAIIGTATV